MQDTDCSSLPPWQYAIFVHPSDLYLICFGLVLYGIGIVELTLESTSALVLLLFIVPLAFTLSGFLLWIMYALNGMWQII